MNEKSRTLAALVELANLPDAPQAVKRFRAKNPGFVPEDMHIPIAVKLPSAFIGADLPPVETGRLLHLRSLLRELWGNSGERVNDIAAHLLFAGHLKEGKDIEDDILSSPLGIDWQQGRIAYKPLDDFQAALYALMQRSRLARVCARPGCAAPYFVASRVTQQYCSSDCADAMQDQWRRNWWKNHGNEWRKKRKQHSKGKRGKSQ